MWWAASFVQFGNAVFILPLVLNRFSTEDQNIWFFLTFIMGIAMLADSGFGPTMVRAFSYFRSGAEKIPRTKEEFENSKIVTSAHPNYEKLNDLLTTSNNIYLFIGLGVILFLSTAGTALIYNLMKQAGNRPDLWIAFGIFSIYCTIAIMNVRWTSAIRGLDYVAFESRLNTVMALIKVLVFTILLFFHQGIISLVVYLLLDSLFKFFYFRKFVLTWFRENSSKIKNKYYFDKEIFHSIWRTTWKSGLTFVAIYLISYVDTLIVGQFRDTKSINSFFITKRIFAFIKGFSNAPFYANVQRIYSVGATKDFKLLRQKAATYIFYCMVVLFAGIIGLALTGNYLLGLFTDTRLVELPIFIILSLTMILEFHSSFHADIYLSTNHFPFLIPATLTGIIISVAGILVSNKFGLFGLVLVPLFSSMLINNWYSVYLSFKLVNWNLFTYFRDLYVYGTKDMKYRLETVLNKFKN